MKATRKECAMVIQLEQSVRGTASSLPTIPAHAVTYTFDSLPLQYGSKIGPVALARPHLIHKRDTAMGCAFLLSPSAIWFAHSASSLSTLVFVNWQWWLAARLVDSRHSSGPCSIPNGCRG